MKYGANYILSKLFYREKLKNKPLNLKIYISTFTRILQMKQGLEQQGQASVFSKHMKRQHTKVWQLLMIIIILHLTN